MNSEIKLGSVEMLETKPINELASETIIKVCYVSDDPNRNQTVISKQVGEQLAATLPGAPIAGLFNFDKQDFEEHSEEVVIQDGKVIFRDLTKPYGFVSPTEKPWYQDFEEDGEVRTYLMCKGYLWTRQYEEAKKAFEKAQSMEILESTYSGYYSDGAFVFTSAEIDKLCILGTEYEPCFEGAKLMTTYSQEYSDLINNIRTQFKLNLYAKENKVALEVPEEKGLNYSCVLSTDLYRVVRSIVWSGPLWDYDIYGIFYENDKPYVVIQHDTTGVYIRIEILIAENGEISLGSDLVQVEINCTPKALNQEQPTTPEPIPVQEQSSQTSPVPLTPTYYQEGDMNMSQTPETNPQATVPETTPEPTVDYAAQLAAKDVELANSATQMTKLEEELAALKEFKAQAEKKDKEALIESYSAALTEAELESVKEGIENYTLDEIEAKCAIIYSRKAKVNNFSAMQADIGALGIPANENIPEFLRVAMEYDKQNEL